MSLFHLNKNALFALLIFINLSIVFSQDGSKDKCSSIEKCSKCPSPPECEVCEDGYKLAEDKKKCELIGSNKSNKASASASNKPQSSNVAKASSKKSNEKVGDASNAPMASNDAFLGKENKASNIKVPSNPKTRKYIFMAGVALLALIIICIIYRKKKADYYNNDFSEFDKGVVKKVVIH